MAFTQAEKVQAAKFVNGMIELMQGVTKLAQVGRTHGHLLRPQLHELTNTIQGAWSAARRWFSDFSGTPRVGIGEDRTRDVVIATAKEGYEKTMFYMNGAANSVKLNAVPQFADAYVHIKAARDIFTGLNWSLAYANPRHDDETPFPDDKTIVGPHGDWSRATATMKFTMWYLGLMWRDFLTLYKSAPVYVEEANDALGDQIELIAHMADRVSRVYSMHIEVEAPQDKAAIDSDFAHDSGARLRSFHRAMRQVELLFNNRLSEGKNHYGRDFEVGGLHTFELHTLERFFLPLAKANTSQWVYDQVISATGQFGGPHAGITGKLTDFWQVYDAWAQSALGFYHAMPSPTVFKPKEAPPDEPAVIPMGFFDAEAQEIAMRQAELAEIDAGLDTLRLDLKALEGTVI